MPWTDASQQTTQQQQAGATQQQNLYGQGQQALQSQIPGLYSQLVGGGLSTFTNPQALLDMYKQQWNNQGAPGVAAQFGAGSPQMMSQYNQGLTNLLGNQYNTGISNYLAALGGAGGYGLTGIGSTGQTAQQGETNTQQQIGQTLLGMLMNLAYTNPFSPSDERLKKNIKSLDKEKAVEQIKKLRSVEFNWREEANNDERLQLGFIAQEVEKVIPEAVINVDDTYLLNKEAIIPVLVAAIQELAERLEKLEKDG